METSIYLHVTKECERYRKYANFKHLSFLYTFANRSANNI